MQDTSCSSKTLGRSEIDKIACEADLRFDATGNRLQPFNKFDLIKSNNWNYQDMMQKSFPITMSNGYTRIKNQVVSHGGFLFPIFGNLGAYSIHYLKILHLPLALIEHLRTITDTCKWKVCGQIYLWSGSRTDLAMFFNLRWHEIRIFRKLIDDQVGGSQLSNSFLQNVSENSLNAGGITVENRLLRTLRSILVVCQQNRIPGCAEVRVAGPYEYDPFFIMPNASNSLKPDVGSSDWIRIGDSVFQGDFTLGNGLGEHLTIIGNVVRSIHVKYPPDFGDTT